MHCRIQAKRISKQLRCVAKQANNIFTSDIFLLLIYTFTPKLLRDAKQMKRVPEVLGNRHNHFPKYCLLRGILYLYQFPRTFTQTFLP